MVVNVEWSARAACRGTDPDELFVQGAAQNRVKMMCGGCPVRTDCLADALDNRIEFGVWGGMTERERRALLRRRPDVKSWYKLLSKAQEAFELGETATVDVTAARAVVIPSSRTVDIREAAGAVSGF